MDKWVPHKLNEDHKFQSFEISPGLLLCRQNDSFLNWIVTYHRNWILHHNRKHSEQCLNAQKVRQHFPKSILHQKKVMVNIWWSSTDLIHHTIKNPDKTIAAEKYCRVIDEMHQKHTRKMTALVSRKGSILHHDNVRSHVSIMDVVNDYS